MPHELTSTKCLLLCHCKVMLPGVAVAVLLQVIGMAGVFSDDHPERARAMNYVFVGSIALCG